MNPCKRIRSLGWILCMCLWIFPFSVLAAEDTIEVNNYKEAVAVLAGEKGDITGKTIHFTGNIDEVLDLALPSPYKESQTQYEKYVNGSGNQYEKTDNLEELTEGSRYYRTLKDVTFTADEGVTVAGFTFSAGHAHGEDTYDPVRETKGKYYRHSSLDNLSFEGLTITGDVYFKLYMEGCSVSNITFDGCTFTGATAANNRAAINMTSDTQYFQNTIVKNCKITNCYQGIHIQGINGAVIANNTIQNTVHNAIAIQSSTDNFVKGIVLVEENYITGAQDRPLRINEVSMYGQIKIENNIMVNSGDGDNQMIKSTTNLTAGTQISLNDNYWDGKDMKTAIGANVPTPSKTGVAAGTFPVDPSPYVSGSEPVAQITTGTEKFFAVGNASIIAETEAGSTVTILQGNAELTLPEDQKIVVKNQGNGAVKVNGDTVAKNQAVTVGQSNSTNTSGVQNPIEGEFANSALQAPAVSEIPKTGDESDAGGWAALLMAALIGIAVFSRKKRLN